VPDIYQGTEVWDLSLVDPDNRRPVDYDERRRVLEKVQEATAAEVLSSAVDGAPKLWLTRRALDVRRRLPECFERAPYRPLAGAGERADHVVAYLRGDRVAVVVPRLVLGLGDGWGDTTITLPPGRWTDELGGSTADEGPVSLAALLSGFPVALLVRN
jgi:(1->4)-alpha-D-glucan 1-alpha-D-glucosylmutase